MKELSFITSNLHKVEEVRDALKDLNLKVNHVKMQYTELQADTIMKVVLASATDLATTIEGKFFIEDSGISVDALSGFPGPYSSYVFRTIGWQGIIKLMEEVENRKAHFTSIFAFWDGWKLSTFEGITEGTIAHQGRGDMGFGFDPIFIPIHKLNEDNLTYAQIPLVLKNQVSHRGKSLSLLKQYLANSSIE